MQGTPLLATRYKDTNFGPEQPGYPELSVCGATKAAHKPLGEFPNGSRYFHIVRFP